MNRLKKNLNNKGLTLTELIVAIIIIGVLSGVAVLAFNHQRRRAWEAAARADIRTTITAIESHRASHRSAPERWEHVTQSGGRTSDGVAVWGFYPGGHACAATTLDYVIVTQHTSAPENFFVFSSWTGLTEMVEQDGLQELLGADNPQTPLVENARHIAFENSYANENREFIPSESLIQQPTLCATGDAGTFVGGGTGGGNNVAGGSPNLAEREQWRPIPQEPWNLNNVRFDWVHVDGAASYICQYRINHQGDWRQCEARGTGNSRWAQIDPGGPDRAVTIRVTPVDSNGTRGFASSDVTGRTATLDEWNEWMGGFGTIPVSTEPGLWTRFIFQGGIFDTLNFTHPGTTSTNGPAIRAWLSDFQNVRELLNQPYNARDIFNPYRTSWQQSGTAANNWGLGRDYVAVLRTVITGQGDITFNVGVDDMFQIFLDGRPVGVIGDCCWVNRPRTVTLSGEHILDFVMVQGSGGEGLWTNLQPGNFPNGVVTSMFPVAPVGGVETEEIEDYWLWSQPIPGNIDVINNPNGFIGRNFSQVPRTGSSDIGWMASGRLVPFREGDVFTLRQTGVSVAGHGGLNGSRVGVYWFDANHNFVGQNNISAAGLAGGAASPINVTFSFGTGTNNPPPAGATYFAVGARWVERNGVESLTITRGIYESAPVPAIEWPPTGDNIIWQSSFEDGWVTTPQNGHSITQEWSASGNNSLLFQANGGNNFVRPTIGGSAIANARFLVPGRTYHASALLHVAEPIPVQGQRNDGIERFAAISIWADNGQDTSIIDNWRRAGTRPPVVNGYIQPGTHLIEVTATIPTTARAGTVILDGVQVLGTRVFMDNVVIRDITPVNAAQVDYWALSNPVQRDLHENNQQIGRHWTEIAFGTNQNEFMSVTQPIPFNQGDRFIWNQTGIVGNPNVVVQNRGHSRVHWLDSNGNVISVTIHDGPASSIGNPFFINSIIGAGGNHVPPAGATSFMFGARWMNNGGSATLTRG